MAFVPGYKHDIFVSYAHVDDVPIVEGRGWVSTFVDQLRRSLAMRLGRADAYSIWMDRWLNGNEPFSDALLQNIKQSAALVIILSPGYLASEWCRRESNAFLETIRNKSHADRRVFRRVFIVQIRPTDRNDWPQEFTNLVGYQFWQVTDDDTPLTLGFPSLDGRDDEYFSRLERLVRDLVDLMKTLAESGSEAARHVPESVDLHAPELASADAAWLDERRDRGEYDVFLCHNSEDKPAVKQIAELLIEKRVVPWLDEWDLRPGLPWQRALEAQIEQIKAAAVFVGESGFGPWQDMELDALLREFVARRCPVIPVILSACGNLPQLPTFLRGFTWVDFRKSTPEPVGQLIWGITGKRPTTR
jgi:nucleotide-binding universal stress UspA family protein